jgi:hypothetical protein
MYKLRTFYFPLFFVYTSPLVLAGGIFLIVAGHQFWGIVLAILALLFSTTHYATIIDRGKRWFEDYLFVGGLRLNGESGQFSSPEMIVITRGDYAYKAATRSRDRSVQFNDYSATLLFSGGGQLDLLTESAKKELLQKIKPLAAYLEVQVEDRSVRDPFLIDLSRV